MSNQLMQSGALRVRLAIMDWSGTISDDRRLTYEANMRVIESRGHKRMAYERWLRGAESNAAEFYHRIGMCCTSPDGLIQETNRHFDDLKRNGFAPRMYPDAADSLSAIKAKGIEIAVISSHPTEHLVAEARQYGIEHMFTSLTGSVTNKAGSIMGLLRGTSGRHAAYVGDTTFDIASAKSAGVFPVAITTGYHAEDLLRCERPAAVVGSLKELAGLLDYP